MRRSDPTSFPAARRNALAVPVRASAHHSPPSAHSIARLGGEALQRAVIAPQNATPAQQTAYDALIAAGR